MKFLFCEVYLYFVLVGIFQIMFFMLFSLLLILSNRIKKISGITLSIIRVGIFNLFLLGLGALAHIIWTISIYGKYYKSQDYAVDFYPFFPFGQWVLDRYFSNPSITGELLGETTLFEMQLIWLLFALPVWLLSWKFTVFFVKKYKYRMSR